MSKLSIHVITIDIDEDLNISENTAKTCLQLLEAYMNAHPEMDLIGHFDERGCVSYELKKKGGPDEYATD